MGIVIIIILMSVIHFTPSGLDFRLRYLGKTCIRSVLEGHHLSPFAPVRVDSSSPNLTLPIALLLPALLMSSLLMTSHLAPLHLLIDSQILHLPR